MSLAACADLVERADPLRFRCAMAAPIETQDKLLPLYAFNIEISRAPWVTQEPMIAEMRLQWWRDVVEEMANGGVVRSHEVVDAVTKVIKEAGVNPMLLDQMIAARRWDIYRDAFEDRSHFDEYIDQTAATLMWVSAQVLGADVEREQDIRAFGYGTGIAMMLQAAAELQSRGRIPLIDGTHQGIQSISKEGLLRLRECRPVGRKIAPALWPGYQTEALLHSAIAQPHRVADGNLELSEFQKNWRLLQRQILGKA
ncbi:MAG: squalene/phytoene synthase family protein [Litoreibacter sp.]